MSDAAITAAIELLEYQGYTVLHPDQVPVLILTLHDLVDLDFLVDDAGIEELKAISDGITDNENFYWTYETTLQDTARALGLKQVKYDNQNA